MRCVIVAGGEIKNYEKIKSYLKPGDTFYICDSGLYHIEKLGISPHLIIGDFDSYTDDVTADCEVITLPPEKDDTDSFYAVKSALKNGFCNILLIGCTGKRFDHTMANISALYYIHSQNAYGEIIDDYGRYFLSGKRAVIKKNDCKYFSIIPIGDKLSSVTIKGAKYNLENAKIDMNYLYSTSNEVERDFCEITIKSGNAVIFLTED